MASHSFHAARLRKSVEEFAFDLRFEAADAAEPADLGGPVGERRSWRLRADPKAASHASDQARPWRTCAESYPVALTLESGGSCRNPSDRSAPISRNL